MAKSVKRRGPPPEGGTEGTRAIFLTGLGAVILIAHVGLWVQLEGLIGARGIAPSGDFLTAVEGALDRRGALPVADAGGVVTTAATSVLRLLAKLSWAPTLGWVLPASWGPHLLAAAGSLAAIAVIARRYTAPALLVAWVTYLSLSVLGQDFLAFQWDMLLVEVTFAAVLVAPWGKAARFAPPDAGWWLLRWILFRLVFFGGLVKLTSGDPTWRNLTAMRFHYETQPLPNPLSPSFHALPGWFQGASTVFTFAIELVLVFAMFFGRTGRLVAFAAIVVLMGLLALTGNYGFFQLLAIVLATSLLDDGHWRRLAPRWLLPTLPPLPRPGLVATGTLAGALVALSVLTAIPRYLGAGLPRPLAAIGEAASPWRTVNHYGLFAVMTTERPIPVLEARWGDGPWTELTWRWQTSDPARGPAQVAPYMPRLDWQLWFAGLAGRCESEPWTVAVMVRVLEGSPPVKDLIGDLRLRASRPPDAVRMRLWRYHLAAPGTSPAWTREDRGLFCDELTGADLAGIARGTHEIAPYGGVDGAGAGR